MFYRRRIGCYLFHILFCIQVKNLKLRILLKDCFLCLIILFDDLQLCFKLFIKQYSPYLRCGWMILCNLYDEIIDRSVIMWCGCFTDDVGSIRNRNTAGIPFLIRKDLCCTIFSDHYRLGRIKVIATIFFYCQGRYQISGKTCTFQ